MPVRKLCRLTAAVLTVAATQAVAQQSSDATSGALTGRVTVDASPVGINGAVITAVGTSLFARTDTSGRYFLGRLPGGPIKIRVQMIGFVAIEQEIRIVTGTATPVDFRLIRPITKLDTQRVKADNWMHKPARLANTTKYDEFYERKVMSGGGYQWTHEELEKKVNASLAEVFSTVPSVRIQRFGSTYRITLPFCKEKDMVVFLDRQKIYPVAGVKGDAPLAILNDLDLQQVEAIEFYKSVSGMPAEARGDACAALYIWTR